MKLILFLRIALLALIVTISGCGSDDHEGVFNENSGNQSEINGTTNDLTSGAEISKSSISGIGADVRISEPAIVYIVDGAGSLSSTDIDGGMFFYNSTELVYPILLTLVPTKSGVPNWEGNIQTKFIFESPVEAIGLPVTTKTVSANLKLAYLADMNPITTAVSNLMLKNHDFDAVNYLKKLLVADEEIATLNSAYISLAASLTVEEFDQALEKIVGAWGKNSDDSLVFSVDLFNSVSYTPRKSFTEDCSIDQILMEALANKLGKDNLGNSILSYSETNTGSVNLLNDSEFQSGLLLGLFSLNFYQLNKDIDVSAALDDILVNQENYASYIDKMQDVLDFIVNSEKNKQSSEADVLLKIQNKLSTSTIPSVE